MQKSARTHRANVRGQEWVDKRRRAEEKWEEKLIIYSPQVLAHYWDCAVLFTICKTLTEPLAAAARPSSQGQTQTQLCSQTTVCPPTPVNPLGEWTLPLHFATSCIIYADAYHHMQDFLMMVLNVFLLWNKQFCFRFFCFTGQTAKRQMIYTVAFSDCTSHPFISKHLSDLYYRGSGTLAPYAQLFPSMLPLSLYFVSSLSWTQHSFHSNTE